MWADLQIRPAPRAGTALGCRATQKVAMKRGTRNHRIYTGSFATLEPRWMDTIFELQGADPLQEINTLVGSNILASYLKRRLAEKGRTVANLRFHTFLDLVGRITSAVRNAAHKQQLPRLGPPILLEHLLGEKTPSVYNALSGYRGFRDALLETFRDLRDAGFSPAELDAAVQENKNADRRQHLRSFAEVYRRYRERVSLFQDVNEDFHAAIQQAAENRGSLPFQQILIYGIYDATGQQSRLLSALKDSVDLIYFIPFVDESVSEFARPFMESRAVELNVAPTPLQSHPPSNSLESLAEGAFGFSERKTAACADDGSFALISVPGESRAAVEILREIFRAVQDGTIRGFHESAVVLRQPESDIPILVEMFRLRGVPCFVHGGLSFAERPLGKAVLALSRLESKSFAREAILSAMELVAASLASGPISEWDVQGWRVLTNDPSFLTGLASWDSGIKGLIEKLSAELAKPEANPAEQPDEDEETPSRSGQALRQRLDVIMRLRDAWQRIKSTAADWPSSLSWGEWADFLRQRFRALLGESTDWEYLSSILDDIGSLQRLTDFDARGLNPRNASVEKLRSALSEAILSGVCPSGRFQRSGVNLLSTSAARGLRFPLVIIPGLDEGRFPSRLRQDPLLLDTERSRMGTLPVKSKRIDEEKLMFDMAARSAEKRLVLMSSRLDEGSDRERIPSQFFLRAASAVHGRAVALRDLAQGSLTGFRSVSLDNPAPAKNQIAVDEGEIRLRIVTADRRLASAAVRTLAQLDPLRFSRPLQFDQARWVHRLTAFDGVISEPLLVRWIVQKLGVSAGQVSASRLEEYAKCPYYFFLKRAMGLQVWEEEGKTEAMDPLDRGVVIHSILEKFLRDFGGEIFQSDRDKLWHSLETLGRAVLDRAKPSGMADLLWDVERDGLIEMLRGWLEYELERADPNMRVARVEQVFGEFNPEEKFPAYRLQAGRHAFEFRGRIDRVDLSRDGKRARVVDYKTGSLPESMANKSTKTPLMSGERIQLLLYALALSVLKEYKGVETVEGEYLHLQPKNGLTAPCAFTHEEFQTAARALPALLEMIGSGIESGIFFARTSGRIRPSGHCDFCEYLPVCGKDRIHREERKAADPAVQKFMRTVEPL